MCFSFLCTQFALGYLFVCLFVIGRNVNVSVFISILSGKWLFILDLFDELYGTATKPTKVHIAVQWKCFHVCAPYSNECYECCVCASKCIRQHIAHDIYVIHTLNRPTKTLFETFPIPRQRAFFVDFAHSHYFSIRFPSSTACYLYRFISLCDSLICPAAWK